MLIDVVMPKMGESIQEGKILRWMKKPGEKIDRDESILEISTDKVDSEIPSPAEGFLSKIVIPEGETVEVGTVIAVIETDAAAAKTAQSAGSKVEATKPSAKPVVEVTTAEIAAPATTSSEFGRDEGRFYSPLVLTIAKKEGIDLQELSHIEGTGLGGRVTRKDVEAFLRNRISSRVSPEQASPATVDARELQKKYPSPEFEIVQMDNVQLRMAEHMVRSVRTSPHVEAISECDISRIDEFRSQNAGTFERQEGYKLTYTPFFAEATIRALKAFPLINSSVEGDKIILKKSINLGIAVSSPSGLIVPVIKEAHRKDFLSIARSINDLASRTRTKHLMPEEIQGGTFTITNYGVFGNIIGTPIINQPQVAILGVGAVKKRPVIVTDGEKNDSIAIRSMVFLTLAFDHRIVDGALGGQFLSKIVSNLEQFDFSRIF